MLFMDPDGDSFPFYTRTVYSQIVTKITRVGSATDPKSDRSEFVFRPVPCKRMKRNVWRAIRTHTGPSSSRSHVITPYVFFVPPLLACRPVCTRALRPTRRPVCHQVRRPPSLSLSASVLTSVSAANLVSVSTDVSMSTCASL